MTITNPTSAPSAGLWGVLDTYGYPVVEITRVSEQCFWSRGGTWRGTRETRAYLDKLVCFSRVRSAAEKASARLTSAEAEKDRRIAAARLWFTRERKKIAASVDRSPKGGNGAAGAVEDESAVGAAETPATGIGTPTKQGEE